MINKSWVIGEVIEPPAKEGLQFDTTEDGALLIIRFGNPTRDERKAIKSGAAQFKVAQIDGILFFLCRFGSFQWMDAPYHPDMAQASPLSLHQPTDGEGVLLHILLVNCATGVLCEQRTIGLSTQLTRKIISTAEQLPALGADYHQRLSAVYSRYQTVDMLRMASRE